MFVLVLSFLCVSISGALYALFSGELINDIEAWNSRYYIALMALGFGVGNLLTIKLYRFLQASIVAILLLLNTLSSVVFSKIFLDERFTITQWLGSFLVIAGVLSLQLISKTSNKKTK